LTTIRTNGESDDMKRLTTPEHLNSVVGDDLGVTGWRQVTQEMVDQFAMTTGDHQWVHTDVPWAVAGPFGAPIAHGFLVLAITTALLSSEIIQVDGAKLILNRGLRQARISAPVRVGDRIRVRARVVSARGRPHGYWEAVFGIAVESTGADDPVLTADLVFLY
jgi:acyl dehydratase